MSAEITDAAPPANQPAALDMPPPLHFSFWDQKRAWRFNGKPLSEEPPQSTTDSGRISHSYTWAFYQRLLDRAGLAEWGKTR